MTRKFLTQFGEREAIDQPFLASEKQLRTNRNGNLYLQVRLADRTGSTVGMLWNAGDAAYSAFENGDYVRVQGTSQFYNGGLQIIINRIDRAAPETIDPADYITLDDSAVQKLSQRLADHLRSVRNVHLRRLGEAFLADEPLIKKFQSAPAGVKNHHAYQGGLLQHVVGLMDLCRLVAGHYAELDSDELLFGAFLHDIGKIDELTYERDLGYSDEGQLIGHVVMGVSLLEAKIREISAGEPFPVELALRLKHMIVSHHGQYEFGSPKLPMTLEAITLHHLDDLDAKLYNVGKLMQDDANTDSPWTPFQASLQRKFFKGSR